MNDQEYWDWLKHEDNLLIARGNYFMVAQAMLFAAAAQLLTAKLSAPFSVLSLFGILTALVWLLVNYRQVDETIDKLKTELKDVQWYKPINEGRTSGLTGPTRLIAYLLPCLTILAWVFFFFTGKHAFSA